MDFSSRLARWVQWWGARHTEVQRAYDEAMRSAGAATPATAEGAWDDFEQRPAEYYSWLSTIVGVDQREVERGELPEEIVASIRAFKLDLSLVTASVRGYQEFGARFALVQERTILGDEMGLGKTVQAIAAMAHLAAAGERHALVVCPASVLVNWQRELARHSRLTAYRLHGEERAAAVAEWIRDGGVGVTTYGQLYALDIPAKLPISLLVADEAHYLKNPLSQRSLAFQRYLSRCPRVLLMSGTPLENRLDEFATLVGYLQPQLLAQIDPAAALVKAAAFREAVAPVYLRRNQEDVLTELPDLVETDEWIDLTRTDREVYAAAVRSGNFMAMRQAAWRGAQGQPAKLERLLEIVEESTDNGHRVIVFSLFRSVLERIAAALTSELPGVPVFGPLTGSLTAEARQRLVDDFGRSERPGVLVSQIEAGGVGLNIQSASVVVLTEPQIKPSSESQAIARVHRMGQVRTVQVHRLLADDSVDERMQEILREKEAVFAAYVRDSAVSEAAPEAIDVSERNLAARIIAEEQRRLGLGPSDTMAQPQDSASAPQDSASAPQDSASAPQDSTPVPPPKG
ncbi:MAG: DEAD/DEAH box helicase [Dermatophilaceae bacterium]